MRVGLVAAPTPPPPPSILAASSSPPQACTLFTLDQLSVFFSAQISALCNNLHPSRGNACCPLLALAGLSVHLVKMPVIPNSIRNTKHKSAYGSSINPVCTQTPGSVFNIKRAHLCRFFSHYFPPLMLKVKCVFPPVCPNPVNPPGVFPSSVTSSFFRICLSFSRLN